MPISPGRKHHHKPMADFFPEEHIIVTSGLVLLVIAFMVMIPTFSSTARSTQVAFSGQEASPVSFSLIDVFLTGVGALGIVFIIVFLTWKYSRNRSSKEKQYN